MKKFFLFATTIAFVLGLTSCNKEDNAPSEPEKDTFVTRELPVSVENANPRLFIKTEEQDATLKTLTRVDSLGELYIMDYTADYCLEQMIAAGGVKSNAELLGFAQKNLLDISLSAKDLEHDFGCSSFLVQDQNGHWLFCRNFDYQFKEPVNVVTRTKGTIGTFCMNMAIKSATSGSPDDGWSDNSLYVVAPLGMVDGMNENGVAISVLVVKSYGAEQHEVGKSNITTTAIVREILDKAKNVDDALKLFDSHNFFAHGGSWQSNYHFFIADATGRSVVVEYVNSGRDNKDDKNFHKEVIESRYVTNNFLYPAFREPLSDEWREALIAEKINSVKTKSQAFQLLNDVFQTYEEEGKTYPETLWSLVYDLTDKTTYIITGHEMKQGKAPFTVPMLK